MWKRISENVTMLAPITPIVFTTKSKREPVISGQSRCEMPIPVTAIGGISATEIAMPGKVSESCSFTRAKEAAKPTMMAITTEVRAGSDLKRISGVMSPNWFINIRLAIFAPAMPRTTDFNNVQKERETRFISAMVMPRDRDSTG